MPVLLPDAVRAFSARGPEWAAFVDRLPRLAADLLGEWELRPDGPPGHGACSLVLPVRTDAGRPAVLKLGYPDEESEHEHLALGRWGGRGAALLLRADPRRRALLLERLGPSSLATLDEVAACEVVAGLYGRLHVPALPRLRRLSTYVQRWGGDLATLPRDAPVPRRLVEQALTLGRALAADPATDAVLVHTDLHDANVLAGGREPWLAIDPKPLAGDPHYEPAPMLWNRWPEVVASGNVRAAVRRRLEVLVDTAGLDEDRARDWVVVRMVHNALWCVQDAQDRPMTADDREWLTICVTVAKAARA
jgi:streptomycin 6-kinase